MHPTTPLNEQARRAVYADLAAADDRADAECRAEAPPDDSAAARAWAVRRRALMAEFRAAVSRRHGLTRDEALGITVEGVRKSWPVPGR